MEQVLVQKIGEYEHVHRDREGRHTSFVVEVAHSVVGVAESAKVDEDEIIRR
jgi:hypothetical protein